MSLRRCVLCGREAANSEFLEHVLKAHGLSEGDYKSIAKALVKPEVLEDPEEAVTKNTLPTQDPNTNNSLQPITNGCKFKCQYCDQRTLSWQQMRKHVGREHKDKGKCGDPFELVVEHKIYQCAQCRKPILQDKHLVRRHMREAHRMLLPKPKRPWLATNECKFQCKHCSQVLSSWEATMIHHRNNHKSLGKLPLPIDMVIESKFNECKLCGNEVLTDKRLIYYHMRNAHGYGKNQIDKNKQKRKIPKKKRDKGLIISECKFKCKHCSKILGNWRATLIHHRTNHKSQGKLPQPRDAVIESKFQACTHCGEELLKDSKLIYYHMRNKHMKRKDRRRQKEPQVRKPQRSRKEEQRQKEPGIVKNECTFQCKHCHAVFENWESTVTHHQNYHLSLGDYDLPGDSLVSGKYHACCLCGKEVLKDDNLVSFHISVAHNISAIDYKKWLILKSQKKIDQDANKKNWLTDDPLTNGCKFKCKYCGNERTSWKQMTRHIFRTHGIKIVHDPFKMVVDHKIFECQECKKPILQDRSLIYSHMYSAHKKKISEDKTTKERRNKGLITSECKFKCKHCPKILNNWGATLIHHRTNHMSLGKFPLPRDVVIESKFQACTLCGEELLKDSRLIYNHMRTTHMNRKGERRKKEPRMRNSHMIPSPKTVPKRIGLVINECKFRCKHCPKVLESWDSVLYHYRTNHTTVGGGAPVPQDCATDSKFHTCCLCKANVLKDNRIIYDHIRVAHNLTSSLYKRWLNIKSKSKKINIKQESKPKDDKIEQVSNNETEKENTRSIITPPLLKGFPPDNFVLPEEPYTCASPDEQDSLVLPDDQDSLDTIISSEELDNLVSRYEQGTLESADGQDTHMLQDGLDTFMSSDEDTYERNEALSGDHTCPECKFIFSTMENLKIHLTNIHCVSDATSPQSNVAADVKLAHDQDTIISSRELENLVSHYEQGTLESLNGQNSFMSSEEDIPERKEALSGDHTCHKCKIIFSSMETLKIHLTNIHSGPESILNTSPQSNSVPDKRMNHGQETINNTYEPNNLVSLEQGTHKSPNEQEALMLQDEQDTPDPESPDEKGNIVLQDEEGLRGSPDDIQILTQPSGGADKVQDNRPSVNAREEDHCPVGGTEKGTAKKSDVIEIEIHEEARNNDAQFGNMVASFLRESKLSKVAKLAVQGEILATIARHIS